MRCKVMNWRLVWGLVVSTIVVALSPAAVLGETRYFEPADGVGYWDVAMWWDPSGVPVAGEIARVEAIGSGWTLFCIYRNAANPLLDYLYVDNPGGGTGATALARLTQAQDDLHADREYVGYEGPGEHLQSGGTVEIDTSLELGGHTNGDGYYELSNGTLTTTNTCRIGILGTGEFMHTGGTHVNDLMRVGTTNNGPGTYYLQGTGDLTTRGMSVGGAGMGTFEQSGGTCTVTAALDICPTTDGAGGTYTLTSGNLYSNTTRMGFSGATFDHSGGLHEVTTNLKVGDKPDLDDTAWYILSGTGQLTVEGNIVIGEYGPGRYQQYGGTAEVDDMVDIRADSKLYLEGGTLTVDGKGLTTAVENHGNLEVHSTLTVTNGGLTSAIDNLGNLTVFPGGTIEITGSKPLINNGAMYAGGTVAQNAEIHGDVINNDYLLPAPGSSATGNLHIFGDYTAASTAELRIRIGGTTSTEDYDRLSVQGTADLGGTLRVYLIDSFVPSLGDSFAILGFGSRAGDFNTLSLPALPNNWQWQLDYWAGGLTLRVVEGSQIDAWRSVRAHGSGLGNLAIDLDASASGGAVVSETRNNGIQRIEVDFDVDVSGSIIGTAEAEDLTHGGNSTASNQYTISSGHTLVIEFDPGLPDQTCYKIDLAGVIAGLTGDTDCLVRGLIGDVNGDSSTNNTDKSWVASLNGHPVLPDNIRFDLNLDGSVNNTDKSLVASRNGRGASCP